MSTNIRTLDVRPDFRSGLHPWDKIQAALSDISHDHALRLLVPFEPVPLFHWAASQGLVHQTRQTPEGDWEVVFTRNRANTQSTKTAAAMAAADGGRSAPVAIIDLDARGLEPPQPLVRILEALATLPPNASLCARTDRRPVHLYSHLQERGFAGESEEQTDGSFITHIRRA